jgi:predicted DNA-binding transcriptional regulator AlpA
MSRLRKISQQTEQVASVPAPSSLLDVLGAARWLGVSRAKLFELMHEDDFPVIVITEKLIRFDPNSLYQWALKRQKNGRYVALSSL